jgi:hypothetical protein
MERERSRIEEALKDGRAIALRCPDVPYDEWAARVEQPIAAYARSNKIEVIRFQNVHNAANPNAEVCVWAKDAERMRQFVKTLPKEVLGDIEK